MIGNGFDLEHDLPTKYTDFLKFVNNFKNSYILANNVPKRVCDIEDEYLRLIFENHKYKDRVNALQVFTKNNLWIEYFQKVYEQHLVNKENWIDFESEISSVIKTMDKLIKYYESFETGEDKNEKLEKFYKQRLSEIIDIDVLEPQNIKSAIPGLCYFRTCLGILQW